MTMRHTWASMKAAYRHSRQQMTDARQARREGRDWRGAEWDKTPRGRWRLRGVFVGPFFFRRERH